MLHYYGATWFQSSFTRAELSVDPPCFHSKLCLPKMICVHKPRVLDGTTKHNTMFETTVMLKSRLGRAQFILVRHDVSESFETGLIYLYGESNQG